MKLPRDFFKPLAIGAPEPLRELPVRLERMIHFVPPHLEKVRAKVPELIAKVDVVLGNLEDAIPVEAKEAARRGFIEMAKASDFGSTGLWTRINALNSPWVLDDVTEIVARGRRQARRHHAAQGRGTVGHPLSRPAARPARSPPPGAKADPDPRHPGDRRGRQERRGDRRRLPAHARHELGPGRSRRLARHEDHARRRRPPGLQGARGRRRGRRGPRQRPAGPVALHRRQDGRCLRVGRHQAVLRPVRRLLRRGRLRGAVPQRLPHGLRRRLVAAPDPDRHRQARVLARSRRGRASPRRSSTPCPTAPAP